MAEVAEGTLVDGRYLIRERIGSGGMADVYLAEDRQLGREIALKVLHHRFAQDREFVERFRREASAAASLSHPNVVGIFDRGEHHGTYYIAMENIAGRTLKQLIREDAPLPQLRAIHLAEQVLQAAGFAHRRGVIHRDFKPHNVIVGPDDRLKVTDFGIARAGASEMTETGSIMGTAQYLSPEQAQGQRVTGVSDLYSIGVILFELLTGRVPFPGESAVSIALKHVSEPPPPVRQLRPDVHPALAAVVARSLAKDPVARYQNAEEFIAALEGARAAIESGDNGQRTTHWEPLPAAPGPDRRWPLIALAVLALLLGGGAVAWKLISGAKQRPVPGVVGEPIRQAQAILTRAGFEAQPHGVHSLRHPGTVVAEHPAAGTKVDTGSAITLDVSTGPATVPIPGVANLPQAQARQTLQRAGLRPQVRDEASATVQRGLAIGTLPPGGHSVNVGSTVTLRISSGPQQVSVPGVVGSAESDAAATLQGAGLTVQTQTQPASQPKGTVLSQGPSAGTLVDIGSTVTITVSSGQQKARVPGVTGQDQGSAQSTLQGAGFSVNVVQQQSSKPKGQVISQSPGAGSQQPKGSSVTIVVSKGPSSGNNGGANPPNGKGGKQQGSAGGQGGGGQNGG